ncbi:MAG: nitroreductase family deazaflavin-dependent oxidoreductase [Anaerolineales bacterium]|nr:nitroreductase family deazaflavin-dependent oxidoreductase [Anaerolineales bacterium]
MAKTYQVTTRQRLVNRLIQSLIHFGLGPKGNYILTVPGRKSGKLHNIPVTLVEEGDRRWLVAPFGEVNWVRNARAAGQVTLARGGRSETVSITELGPEESAPVLQKYLTDVPYVRPYFEVQPDSPLPAFVAEAPRHPVFLIK